MAYLVSASCWCSVSLKVPPRAEHYTSDPIPGYDCHLAALTVGDGMGELPAGQDVRLVVDVQGCPWIPTLGHDQQTTAQRMHEQQRQQQQQQQQKRTAGGGRSRLPASVAILRTGP